MTDADNTPARRVRDQLLASARELTITADRLRGEVDRGTMPARLGASLAARMDELAARMRARAEDNAPE